MTTAEFSHRLLLTVVDAATAGRLLALLKGAKAPREAPGGRPGKPGNTGAEQGRPGMWARNGNARGRGAGSGTPGDAGAGQERPGTQGQVTTLYAS